MIKMQNANIYDIIGQTNANMCYLIYRFNDLYLPHMTYVICTYYVHSTSSHLYTNTDFTCLYYIVDIMFVCYHIYLYLQDRALILGCIESFQFILCCENIVCVNILCSCHNNQQHNYIYLQ